MESKRTVLNDDNNTDKHSGATGLLTAIGFPDVSAEAELNREDIFDMIRGRITEKGKTKSYFFPKKISWWWSVAASITLAIGLSFYFYKAGYLVGVNELAATYIEVESPINSILKTTLPDGSQITLNSGSTLSYPSFFAKDERRVRIEGEGYFDIQKSDVPFIVEAGELDVEVLGTRFDLKAYTEDEFSWLTLEQGAVKAHIRSHGTNEEITLSPNEQIVLDKTNGDVRVKQVYPELFTYWLSGGISFKNNTLEEIMMVLESRFNTEIIITDERLKKETFYCQFSKDDNLERILYLLSNKGKWKYTISGNKATISK